MVNSNRSSRNKSTIFSRHTRARPAFTTFVRAPSVRRPVHWPRALGFAAPHLIVPGPARPLQPEVFACVCITRICTADPAPSSGLWRTLVSRGQTLGNSVETRNEPAIPPGGSIPVPSPRPVSSHARAAHLKKMGSPRAPYRTTPGAGRMPGVVIRLVTSHGREGRTGGRRGDRTPDHLLVREVLYR